MKPRRRHPLRPAAAPVRYALGFAAVSALVMAAVLGLIYWQVSGLLERHLRTAIEQQIGVLRAQYEREGLAGVLALAREHEARYADGPIHLLVVDGEGRRLAGDLPPIDLPGHAGGEAREQWHDIVLLVTRRGLPEPHLLRAKSTRLGPELRVLVTNDTRDLRQTQRLILQAFGAALAVTLILALAGGLLIARSLLRRVEAVNRTARAIMAGDLGERIPEVGAGDELGGLAEVLNQMLGRIEELMANVQHVTSAIAHDLRTPLGRLRQRLEEARADHQSPEACRALIETALEESDALLRTFEAMLRIAQIEAGSRRSRFTDLEITQVVENVCEAFAAVAEEGGRRLLTRLEPGLRVRGDRELLTQMTANVVENALDHTPPGTVVTVSLRAGEGTVRLVVADTGPGVPPEAREQVFRPFHRLDRSRTRPGSGLGLALVRAIARLHGAEPRLEDNLPGLRVVVELARIRD